MWKAFWGNSSPGINKPLSRDSRIKLLNRSVASLFAWKAARWPPQKTISIELDALQCQMLSKCIPCERVVGETVDAYCRRRMRTSRDMAHKVGTWSKVWCKRVLAWNHHLERAREPNRFPHICNNLLDSHGSEWLAMQRSVGVTSKPRTPNPRNSVWAGRTGTRLNIGRPQVRWKDGVSYAKSMCAFTGSLWARTHRG